MQDVSIWTVVGQVAVFYLVAFPVIGLATHAASWIAYCWRQPGEGFVMAGVRGLKGGYASQEAWEEAVRHGNIEDVLDRVRKGGYPERVKPTREKLARVNAKIRKAEDDREVVLLIDTSCTPGTEGVYGRYWIGHWYRNAITGMLMKLRRADPQNKKVGLFEMVGNKGILTAVATSAMRNAQPQAGEWWQKVTCSNHSGYTDPLKVDSSALFWTMPVRQVELDCGCLVPVNYGNGN